MVLIEFFMISIFKFVCNPDFNACAKEIDLTDFYNSLCNWSFLTITGKIYNCNKNNELRNYNFLINFSKISMALLLIIVPGPKTPETPAL